MIIADTHLHIYPCHDVGLLVSSLGENLGALAPDAVRVGILAEKAGHHVFGAWVNGELSAAGPVPAATPVRGALVIEGRDKPPLYLLPGRQIVTSERLEIQCLLADARIEDGLPARVAVRAALDAGGVPVLSWALGKWLFGRAGIVADLLNAFAPDELLLGDSAMRPVGWPEPSPMRRFKTNGGIVLAGTDPLPHAGEECIAGSYASSVDAILDGEDPVSSLRDVLRSRGLRIRSVGRRRTVFDVLSRMGRSGRGTP